ncbi:MAG: LLM class F420-dependent oxidoreductase [Tepidiformaceae bacterium]
MRFGFWPGANNSWTDILEVSHHAEASGWDGIWFADHFMPNAADTGGPTNEAWTTMAALAASIPRVRLGTLVTGNTYRHPAVLAKMAAGVDIISGGRLILGLGSGWQENEHSAYGLEFSTVGGRLSRLEEACQVIKGLFSNEKTTFHGRYYNLEDAPLAPKPIQDPLPLLIGGGGEQRTLRITAKYADEWNVWGTPQTLREKMAVLERHCADVGRNPAEIQRSAVALLVLTGDEAVIERTKAAGRPVIAGDVEAVRAVIRDYDAAGVHEVIIPDFNLGPMDRKKATMDTFIKDVAPEFR